jgi:transcriptional regulator with XRE-family HTH domain
MPDKHRRDGIAIDPEKVRYFLSLRALSRNSLSARSGIPYRVLTFYLSGERRPRVANFRRLYTALGCGPEDLLKARHGRKHLIDHDVTE